MEVASLADLVTEQIRQRIITGEFKPGQQLKEDDLCKLFAISRPPIREAFKTLEANGLVMRKPRRGVFVSEFTAKDVVEVYTIVAMLYRKGMEMAMEKITKIDRDLLAAQVIRMEDAVKGDPPDLIEYQKAHRSFHEIIMDIAGNERMKMLEKQLRYQLSIISYRSFQRKEHLKASLVLHRQILDAITKKNRAEAMDLTEHHVVSAMESLVKEMAG
ncbi:transcriptional regulator, GntR family [Desulforhopalus singaporensis]|uniref:Transcriptional regulator, GntR family n=2 Tax=Desulforhopalus singaporensis TaxID=91360 RepID=A0A1H0N6Z4_9BACT|nr:transcriptional regulator, GntR family [Desulforhopalus singaporensis]